MPDEIDELVDAQLAKRPRPTFNCHKCGPVDLTPCSDPYPQCPKRFSCVAREGVEPSSTGF